ARDEAGHAVGDEVHLDGSGLPPYAIDRGGEPRGARLEVLAEQFGAVDRESVAAKAPGQRVGVDEDHRTLRIARRHPALAPERPAEREENRRAALEPERAEPGEQARGPRSTLVIGRTRGRMPAKMLRGAQIRGEVDDDAREQRADEDHAHDTSDRDHPLTTAA